MCFHSADQSLSCLSSIMPSPISLSDSIYVFRSYGSYVMKLRSMKSYQDNIYYEFIFNGFSTYFPHGFHWLPHSFHLASIWFHNCFLIASTWFPNCFLTAFTWLPHDFLLISSWILHGICTCFEILLLKYFGISFLIHPRKCLNENWWQLDLPTSAEGGSWRSQLTIIT